jgi:hydrogenase-4 component F
VLALAGFPPFSVFTSEVGILRAGFSASLGLVTAAALVLLLVITAALLTHTSRMLLGGAGTELTAGTQPSAIGASGAAGLAPVILALAACAVLGLYAGPLATLLHSAARTLTGTP